MSSLMHLYWVQMMGHLQELIQVNISVLKGMCMEHQQVMEWNGKEEDDD